MKFLIFKSGKTGATYCWNGKESIVVKAGPMLRELKIRLRPLGHIMDKMPADMKKAINKAYEKDETEFKVGGAKYKVIVKV